MKKLLILILLVVFAIGFAEKVSLMRLEVENKTPFTANVELIEVRGGSEEAIKYYLTIEKHPDFVAGSKMSSTELYTLVRGYYKAYIYACGNPEPAERDLDLTKNYKLVILPCSVAEEFEGDQVLKFSSLADELEKLLEESGPDFSNMRY
jgi:hypothetical protein